MELRYDPGMVPGKAMTGIGHNGGPTMETGTSWRKHCWTQARARLLPTLPIEVVRLRVKRAAEIGLDYRTYASIRATSGHDVIAFLFSTNALRLLAPNPTLPEDRAERLASLVSVGQAALVNGPLTPARVAQPLAGMIAVQAPRAFAGWSETRGAIHALLREQRWPADGVVLIGDTMEERDWSPAAKLAYYLPAERFFAA